MEKKRKDYDLGFSVAYGQGLNAIAEEAGHKGQYIPFDYDKELASGNRTDEFWNGYFVGFDQGYKDYLVIKILVIKTQVEKGIKSTKNDVEKLVQQIMIPTARDSLALKHTGRLGLAIPPPLR